MGVIETICARARANVKRIVLPEGDDPRTVEAAARLHAEGLAQPVLLGRADRIRAVAAERGVGVAGLELVDPGTDGRADAYAQTLFKLRQARGMTREEARDRARDPMYFGMLMVRAGEADGLVSGAVHSTGDMLRPALQVIRTRPGMKLVSSSFLMECPDESIGEKGLVVYADCVVNPCPSAEELANIAVATAETARTLCGIEEPRVAMLSFSTKGSAEHALVDKVREATAIAHRLAPRLKLDGELQFDAALMPEVAAVKAPSSEVAGRANVFVFPDLQAGNICYKITQRLGMARCFAVLQGLDRPCNDLSRGCSVDDIVKTVAATVVQAGAAGQDGGSR